MAMSKKTISRVGAAPIASWRGAKKIAPFSDVVADRCSPRWGCSSSSFASSAASAAAAAPTRPVLVLAQALVVVLAAPADASGLESSRDVLVGVVREVMLNKKN